MDRRKRPRVEIPDYQGPYPRRMLEDARATLMHTINSKDTMMWSRIMSKIGIQPNGDRKTDFDGYGEAATQFSHADLAGDENASTSAAASASWSDEPQSSRQKRVPDRSTFDELLSKSLDDVIGKARNQSAETDAETDCVVLDEGDNPDKNVSILTIDSESTSDLPDKNSSVVTIDSGSDTENGKNAKDEGTGKNVECADDSVILIDETDGSGIQDDRNKTEMKYEPHSVDSERLEDISVTVSCSTTGQDMHSVSMEGSKKSSASSSIDLEALNSGCLVSKQPELKSSKSVSKVLDSKREIMLKCDFCAVELSNDGRMFTHLVKKKHYSASSFYCRRINCNGLTPVQLKRECVLVNPSAKFKTVLAVCPAEKCNKVFLTIHECCKHYRTVHDKTTGTKYALFEVSRDGKFKVSTNKCPTCHITLASTDELKFHMKENDHYPYFLKTRLDTYYRCLGCERFFKTFSLALTHESDAHKNVGDTERELHVFYGPRKMVQHLPGEAATTDEEKEKTDDKTGKSLKETEVDMTGPAQTDTDQQVPAEKGKKRKRKDKKSKSKKKNKVEEDTTVSVEVVCDALADAKASQTTSTPTEKPCATSAKDKSDGELSDDDDNDDNDDYGIDGLEEIADELQDLPVGYKCDYCDMASTSKDTVITHMKKNLHNSASLVLMNATLKPVYVRSPEALREDTHKRAVIAVCPEPSCYQGFHSVSLCIEHYIHFHNEQSEPLYATAVVDSQETLFYELAPGQVQKACPREFQLSPEDIERVYANGDPAYSCFVCSVCNWMVYTHQLMTTHLRRHKRHNLSRIAVNLLWISSGPANKQVHAMLPFPPGKTSLVCKLRNLRCLKKFTPKSSRATKKNLMKVIRKTKWLLKR